jgi:hypothetical protein
VIDHVQRGGRALGWWARCIDDAGGNLAIIADGLLTQAAVNYELDAVKDLYDLRIVRGEPVTTTMRRPPTSAPLIRAHRICCLSQHA